MLQGQLKPRESGFEICSYRRRRRRKNSSVTHLLCLTLNKTNTLTNLADI